MDDQAQSLEKRNLTLHRYSLILVATLYPGWSILLKLFLPDVFDILWQRFALGALHLALLAATFFSGFARKHVGIIFYVLLFVTFVHFFYLTYLSSLSATYIIGCMIVSSVVALVCIQIRPYIAIGSLAIVNALVVIFIADGNQEHSVMLILGLLTMFITNYVMLFSRIKTENKLAAAQKQLESKNNELTDMLVITTNQKRDLEKVNRELDRYVYTVSHDLRSPLMGILGYTDLLNNRLKDKLEHKEAGYIESIFNSVSHLNVMIDDLLRTTKITRIKNPYDEVDIKALVTTIEARLSFKIKEGNIELKVQDNIPRIVCDRIKIGEVFHNLISNAIKYSVANERPKVEITYQELANAHQFCITDNGIGIDAKHHKEIFEMFESADKDQKFESTGFGLNIVQKIIYDHGGRVWVDSREGAGASFYFTIPNNLKVKSVSVSENK